MADYPHAHADSIDAPADFGFTLTAKDMHPEALALLTGVHPACFDPEGHALVKNIHDRKAAGND